MHKTWVLLSAIGLALAGRASAQPSFFGPTGLLETPTADSLSEQAWNVHGHGKDQLITYGASFGVAKGAEVGVTGATPQHGNTKALVNAKYNFLMETAKAPGIAVGGLDIFNQLDLSSGVYVVASKRLNTILNGNGPLAKYNIGVHLGYGWNSIFNDDAFGGFDVNLTQNVQAIVEWINGKTNAGGRISLGKGIRVDLGSYDGDFGGGVSFATFLK